jgi:3-dehydroquinate synthetase
VKSAWLDGEASVSMLEEDADALVAGEPEATIRAVRMSVALKAHVVHQDETEQGTRMLLNLGHTVAHGLEAATQYRGFRHGEAVALGMIAAMRVAQQIEGTRPQETERLTRLLARLGLPTDLDAHLDESVLGFLGSDKKRRGDQIHFVVPRLPGETQVVPLSLERLQQVLRSD